MDTIEEFMSFYTKKKKKILEKVDKVRNFSNHSGICIRTKQFHSDFIWRNFSIRINSRPIQNQPE